MSPTEASVRPILQKEASCLYMTMVPMLEMPFSVGVGWGHCSAVSSRAGAYMYEVARAAWSVLHVVGAVPERAGGLAGWRAGLESSSTASGLAMQLVYE